MTRVFLEIVLFLTPFMVFLVYRAASRDMKIRDRWPLTWLTLIGGVIAVLGLIVPPLLQPSEQGKCYQAAQYVDGKVIPSTEVPCEQATDPGLPGADTPERPAPIAPRNRENPVTPPQPATPPEPQAPG